MPMVAKIDNLRVRRSRGVWVPAFAGTTRGRDDDLILAEHDRGHPAGHQRHEGGDQAINKTVLAGGGGDELLEADLDDVEGGFGARNQGTVGKQLDVDLVGPDR